MRACQYITIPQEQAAPRVAANCSDCAVVDSPVAKWKVVPGFPLGWTRGRYQISSFSILFPPALDSRSRKQDQKPVIIRFPFTVQNPNPVLAFTQS
ncbi:hypothetical protein EVAR_12407_1 [Eumeta japonica]|uniref:Uncharacterized protein n=1 Tax=Eumeta variegata TaxID=151549 RepID=A0A4C1U0M1_EUMVA|nr:hypothetical protein EVAR_12407_1 [Eumeta japonica]